MSSDSHNLEQLAQQIFLSYHNNSNALSFERQFHFYSRLFLWYRLSLFKTKINQYQEEYIGLTIENHLIQLKQIRVGSKLEIDNCQKIRQPLIDLHPNLSRLSKVLFKCLLSKTLYGLNLKPLLLSITTEQELKEQEEALLSDNKAMSVLSTYAINFLFIHKKFVEEKSTKELVSSVIKTLNEYDFSSKDQIILAIYLLTHCIIGESQFYLTRPISSASFLRILNILEDIISHYYFDVFLDAKIEYLVCCRLCNTKSYLEQIILNEVSASSLTSNDKIFLVDKWNNNPQTNRVTFERSEHRNVLFLLAINNPSIFTNS